MATVLNRQRILISGRVQGVGFRPAVYKIARVLGLSGVVFNDTKGVTIELQGPQRAIDEFLRRLHCGPEKPPLAQIKSCEVRDIPVVEGEAGFVIGASESCGTAASEVTAEIATCGECLSEMADPSNFRYRYPFINCTNCGPRYSIVKAIPYDRPNTTMSAFEMCDRCAREYSDPGDRRFHAQPVACPACGPRVWLTDRTGKTTESQSDRVIAQAAKLLLEGRIVAIKGIGGFHLAVDALNEEAVCRLRERKRRDHKPFAMMADSVERIRRYALVSEQAEQLLRSPQCPIVLLPKRAGGPIAGSVARGVGTFGFMLPYAPLHFLLFAEGIEVLVMTSGNISDEPLICKNETALEKLGGVADAFLMHDREIYRQVDDSVVHFVHHQPVVLRRARGYVPTPLVIEERCGEDIFAAGADLKNTFCFVKGNQLICSEHIGDLEDAEVYHHYVGSVEHFGKLFEVEAQIAACDLHPGYLSRRYALGLEGVRVVEIQHHWAHAASVLAEHGVGGPVIALVCDGTGYGTDGAIWGCECMIASLKEFRRLGHLAYYELPGADKAARQAIRPVLSLLRQALPERLELAGLSWLLDAAEQDHRAQRVILEQIEKGVNTVKTSSLGRVFDAVAAMLGLGWYNHFEAQLPMALEAIIEPGIDERYPFEVLEGTNGGFVLDLSRMIRALLADVREGAAGGVVSAKFHNCLAAGLLEMARSARRGCGLNTVALSGGVFCNRYLSNRLVELLRGCGFEVLFNRDVPSNDGGISLGQAAIAAETTGGRIFRRQ